MKPFRQHVAIAVDGGGIKGVIEITEAAEWIELTEGSSVSSVSFSVFSGSNFGRWDELGRKILNDETDWALEIKASKAPHTP
jgi:hypothetical protein